MALLSKSSKAAVSDPLMSNNPISLQVLGICSALAVTTKLDIAFVMRDQMGCAKLTISFLEATIGCICSA